MLRLRKAVLERVTQWLIALVLKSQSANSTSREDILMQVSTSVQRWIVVLAAVAIVLFGGVVTLAQASDPIVRYFGFSGDVTIDGGPVEPGTVIVAMVDDEEVGRTTVNQAGAWILDVVIVGPEPGELLRRDVCRRRSPCSGGMAGGRVLRRAQAAAGAVHRRPGARLRQSLNGFTWREQPGRGGVIQTLARRTGRTAPWRVLNRMTAIKCRRTTKAAGTLMSHGKSSGRRLPAPGPAAYLSIRNPRTGLAR